MSEGQEKDEIAAALIAAGFPTSYARDTSFYIASFENEEQASLYRFAHSDSFLDDLDWDVARLYWSARSNESAPPSPDDLKQLAKLLHGA